MSTATSQHSRKAAAIATSSFAPSFKKLLQAKMSRSPGEGGGLRRRSSSGPLTDQDIDEVVIFLLEKLNDYSDELNSLSTAKESIEKQLQCYHRCLLKLTSKIKHSHGNRALALMEIYFEKMLRLCMRELELQHCFEMWSDMQDELHIAGDTIEQFDTDLESDIWWRNENLSREHLYANNTGQLVQNLEPPPMLVLRSQSVKAAHLEVVEKMRAKMQSICEQLGALHDKISNIQTRQNRDRASFDRFCKLKQSELQVLFPLCTGYFDNRLSAMMLRPKLERLTTKIDRTRRSYSATMNDLYLVSCYIRQFGHQHNKLLDDDGNDLDAVHKPLQV